MPAHHCLLTYIPRAQGGPRGGRRGVANPKPGKPGEFNHRGQRHRGRRGHDTYSSYGSAGSGGDVHAGGDEPRKIVETVPEVTVKTTSGASIAKKTLTGDGKEATPTLGTAVNAQ